MAPPTDLSRGAVVDDGERDAPRPTAATTGAESAVPRPSLARRAARRVRAGFDSPYHVALGGIVAVFLVLGLLQALAVPGFRPLDEPRHVGYAVELTRGHFPTVRDPLPFSNLGNEPVHGSKLITAANHPPLYYVLIAIPIVLSGGLPHLARGVALARLVTLLLGAAGLVMAARACRRLVPDRPAVALLATGCAAVTPAFVNCSAVVMNDSLAFLASAALYDAAFDVLTSGPKRRAVVAFAVWTSIAGLTRFAEILVLPPAMLAVVAGYLYFDRGSFRARFLRGAAVAAASLAGAILTSGLFYLRNYRLYGDVTGAKALMEELHRIPRRPFYIEMFNGHLWVDLCDQLYDRLAGGVAIRDLEWPGRIVFLLGIAGLVKAAIAARGTLRTAPWKNPRLVGGALLLLGFLFVTLPIFEFYAEGGGLSPRYYFPMLFALWFFLALGLSSFGRALVPAATFIGLALWAFIILDAYMSRVVPDRRGPLAAIDGLGNAFVPAPDVVFAILFSVFAAGLAWSAIRMTSLHR